VAPRYTAPQVERLRLLLDQDQPKTALRRADSTLQSEPYWLVYLPKARALEAAGQPDEAVNVLRQRCEQLNDPSYALYVVMAELYVQQQAWKGAAWAVQKTESLDPKRPTFISHLQTIRDTVRQSDKATLQTERSDPAASSSSDP